MGESTLIFCNVTYHDETRIQCMRRAEHGMLLYGAFEPTLLKNALLANSFKNLIDCGFHVFMFRGKYFTSPQLVFTKQVLHTRPPTECFKKSSLEMLCGVPHLPSREPWQSQPVGENLVLVTAQQAIYCTERTVLPKKMCCYREVNRCFKVNI